MTKRIKDYQSGLTAERLREVLRYEPETGDFFWLIAPYRRTDLLGKKAGCQGARYWMIRFDDRLYLAHRLAWLWMHGDWPPQDLEIDHADGTNDNRWANLRLATHTQNMANVKTRKDSGTGLKGVNYCKQTGKWAARLQVEGVHVWLGRHATKEEAKRIWNEAAARIHGEFARLQ